MSSLLFFSHEAHLVLANDYVAESCTLLQQEYSVRSSSLGLTGAGTATTIIPVPFTVKGLASCNLNNLAVGLGADSGRYTSSVSIAGKSSRKQSRNGSDESGKSHVENEIEILC